MTDFNKLSNDMKKQHADALMANPAFVYLIEKHKKASIEAFERCDYTEVNKRDFLFAKYKSIKDFAREVELLTKPRKLFTME